MPNEYGLHAPEEFTDYYWATEEDPEVIIDTLGSKIDEYANYIRNNQLWRKVLRNLRYYYNLYYDESTDSIDMEVKSLGDEGELAGLSVNHFRNLIQHILSLATQNRPAWDTRAVNTDLKSLEQARLGNNILEYYMREMDLERKYYRMAEISLVMLVGYMLIEWDPSLGKDVAVSGDGELSSDGDIGATVMTPIDVVYDVTSHSWDENQWVMCRVKKNRWDLAARYPMYADEILMVEEPQEPAMNFLRWHYPAEQSEKVSVWKFFHKKTDAIPEGRYVEFVGDVQLNDVPLPYQDIPVVRLAASELLMSCFGYSVALDMQGLQESLNAEISAILTNHKSLAVQNVWCRSGTNLTATQLEGGLNLIESDEKPEPLTLLDTPAEVFQFVDVLMQHLEYISGVNSVARGQPEASLKSGTALALIDAKAVQFASGFMAENTRALEDGGTILLRIIRDYAQTERIISVLGRNNRASQQHFTGDDLQNVDRVVVQVGNALTRTLSGRVEIATHLLQQGLIRTPEEYLTVIQTGQMETMLQAENLQLQLLWSENEALRDGIPVYANVLDPHVLHIREHQAVLSSPEIRMDNQLTAIIEGHVMEHMQMLLDPMVQAFQMTLGFQVTVPPIPGMGGPAENGTGQPGSPQLASEEPTGAVNPGPGNDQQMGGPAGMPNLPMAAMMQ